MFSPGPQQEANVPQGSAGGVLGGMLGGGIHGTHDSHCVDEKGLVTYGWVYSPPLSIQLYLYLSIYLSVYINPYQWLCSHNLDLP